MDSSLAHKVKIGARDLSRVNPNGHQPLNANIGLSRKNQLTAQVPVGERLSVFCKSKQNAMSASAQNNVNIPVLNFPGINYVNINFNISTIRTLIIEGKVKLNIKSIIKQIRNKCLSPGKKSKHFRKFIEGMGMPNLLIFCEKDPTTNILKLDKKNKYILNKSGRKYINQYSILLAGIIISEILNVDPTSVCLLRTKEDYRYLEKVADSKKKVKYAEENCIEVIQNKVIEFVEAGTLIHTIIFRSVLRARFVRFETGETEILFYLPTCFPVGNRNKYLNLAWDASKPIPDNEIKQRWAFIIKTFECDYLPEILLKHYRRQNRLQNKLELDVKIFKRIRYELGLAPGDTFPEKIEVFKPIN